MTEDDVYVACVLQKELRSETAVCNAALSAVGVTALQGSCARDLVASNSYKEALSSLLSAWEGTHTLHHTVYTHTKTRTT